MGLIPEAQRVYNGDCLAVMKSWGENFIDTIITDPPYGLSFMGKEWDHGIPGPQFWAEGLRIAKPGAFLLAFGGTRTYHRLAVAIEDAGWEIRDCLMWLYGSGFPKSLDISKAIDKAKGADREIVHEYSDNGRKVPKHQNTHAKWEGEFTVKIIAPSTDLAKQWNGWGTALKPAWEPIIVAMKPTDGTYAENAERWGVAGINVDGGRIGATGCPTRGSGEARKGTSFDVGNFGVLDINKGRWPANLLFDDEAAGMIGDESRFFYVAKSARAERNEGCEGLPEIEKPLMGEFKNNPGRTTPKSSPTARANHHPTVKPLSLMKYLCNLTKTPTGGIVLDPFCGSGTTLWAAEFHNRPWIGIEMNPEYVAIAEARIARERSQIKMAI